MPRAERARPGVRGKSGKRDFKSSREYHEFHASNVAQLRFGVLYHIPAGILTPGNDSSPREQPVKVRLRFGSVDLWAKNVSRAHGGHEVMRSGFERNDRPAVAVGDQPPKLCRTPRKESGEWRLHVVAPLGFLRMSAAVPQVSSSLAVRLLCYRPSSQFALTREGDRP